MKTKLLFFTALLGLSLTAPAQSLQPTDSEMPADTIATDNADYDDLLESILGHNNDPYANEELPTSPTEVKHLIKEEHSNRWYAAQAELWHNAALSRKTDETAWFNYFRAIKYCCDTDTEHTYEQLDSIRLALIDELKLQVPDSYTYYCAAYQLLPKQSDEDNRRYAEEAIKRMPAKKSFYDYDTWLAYYNFTADSARMVPYAKEYLKSGLYSNELLTYTKNLLNTLPQNALYLADGDANIIPKWIIQQGMGLHRDKLVICNSMLIDANYCQHIFTYLGIGEAPKREGLFKDEDELFDYIYNVVNEIVKRTGRPLYLTKNMGDSSYKRWDDNLYYEGMAYHYSLEEIDLDEALRKNYEQHCDLNYLLSPLPDDCWRTDRTMSLQQYANFRYLLPYYLEKKDKKHFKTLQRQLISAGMRYGYSQKEMKQAIKETIAEYNGEEKIEE